MFASKSARNRCSDLRFVSCWPMFDSTRGPVGVVKCRCVRLDSLCACVARDRWHRAWPAIDDDEYTLLLLLLLVVVVPNGHLGALWTKCMFFKKRCSRLGQNQLVKSTSMQKHTFFNLKCKKTKKWLSPRRDAPF